MNKNWKYYIIMIIFLPLSLIIISCGDNDTKSFSSDNTNISESDTSSQESGTKGFSLTRSTTQLAEEYQDSPLYRTIDLSFTKPIKVESNNTTGDKRSVLDDYPYDITKKGWFRLLDNGTKIEISVWLSKDKMSVKIIPKLLLKPDTEYSVVIYSGISSEDNETIDNDIRFDFKTSKDTKLMDINIPDYILEGDTFSGYVSTKMDVKDISWDMDTSSKKDNLIESINEQEITYSYPLAGEYRIKINVKDIYGRSVSGEKNIEVLHNAKRSLENISGIYETKNLDVEEIEDNSLKSALEDLKDSVKSIAEGEKNLTRASLVSNKFIVISMLKDKINIIQNKYIDIIKDTEHFLGIVNFMGFPAIVSYSIDNNKNYKLNILISDYGLNIKDMDIGKYHYSNISIPEINSLPMVYFASIKVDEETIDNLKNYMPTEISGVLPILYYKDSELYLNVPKQTRAYSEWITYAISETKSTIEEGLKILNDLVSDSVYKALIKLKDYFNTIKSLNPFDSIGEFKDAGEQIKNNFLVLYNQYKDDPRGIFGEVSDPDTLMNDIKNFLYNDTGTCVKDVIDNSLDTLGNKAQYVNNLLNNFAEHISDVPGYIKDFLPDPEKDANVYFSYESGVGKLVIENGSNSFSLSYSILDTFSKYSEAFTEKVGEDFPLSYILNAITQLGHNMPSGLTGFFYKSDNQELRFLMKINSDSTDRCEQDTSSAICFGGYLFPDGVRGELGINLSDATGVLLYFQPSSLIFDDADEAGTIYKFLKKSTSIYPEIGITLRTKYRKNYIEINGSTRPDLGVYGGIEFAIEFNYHVLLGGKGKTALNLSIGVDPSGFTQGLLDTVEGIIRGAFNSTKDLLNLTPEVEVVDGEDGPVTIPKLSFPSDEDFINFMDTLLTNIQNQLTLQGLSTLTDSISFGISIGGEIGGGIGAGGTGTGGGSANLKLEGELGVGIDLTTALSFFHFLKVGNVNSFIITPLRNLSEFFQLVTDDVSPKGILTKIVQLHKKTFEELLDNVSINEDYKKQLFRTLAEHMEVSLGLDAGVEAEAEEVGSVEADVSSKPSLTINGETLFNILYSLIGDSEDRNYLDNVGIYPQITLSYPVSAEIKAGFDEGIKISLKGGLQADFVEATVTIKNDPFADNGIHATNTVLKPSVKVKVSSDKIIAHPQDEVTFICSVEPSDATVKWFIENIEISGEGDILINNKKLASVTSLQSNQLKIKDIYADRVNVLCMAQIDDKKSFDHTYITITNTLSGIPQIFFNSNQLENGSIVNGPLSIGGVSDSANTPISYKVEFSSDPDFNNIINTLETDSPQFNLPDVLLPGVLYYVRVIADNGYGYTKYSDIKSFYANVPYIVASQPKDNESICMGNEIEFKGWSNSGGEDILPSLDPVVEISTDSDFTNIIATLTYKGSGFDTWNPSVPGTYYWRIKGFLGTSVTHSDYNTLKIRPAPPEFEFPNELAQDEIFNHGESLTIRLKDVENATKYRIQISNDPSFSNDDNMIYDSNLIDEPLYTIALPHYSDNKVHTLYLRAAVLVDGVWSCWTSSDFPEIHVQNHPPLASMDAPTSPTEACVGDEVSTGFSVDPDIDGDRVTKYEIRIYEKDLLHQDITTPLKTITINQDITNATDIIGTSFTVDKDIGYGDRYIAIVAYDEWGTRIDDDLIVSLGGWGGASSKFMVKNCPPPAPSNISGGDGGNTIIPGQTIYLTVNEKVKDPDDDPIVSWDFFITQPNGTNNTYSVANHENLSYETLQYVPEEQGNYTWKVRAVSQVNGTKQYGLWSEQRSFTVSAPPPVQNISPSNGAILTKPSYTFMVDSNASVRAVKFQVAKDKNFANIVAQSSWTNTQNKDGYYIWDASYNAYENQILYWHAQASYANSPGPWSDTYCFTFISDPDSSPLQVSGNNTYYINNNGTTTLNFNVTNIITNCLGDNGTFTYDICSDPDCKEVLSSGNFTPGKSFDVDLSNPDSYFFKARQIVGGIKRQWSNIVEFNIEKKQIPGIVGLWDFSGCRADDMSGNGFDGVKMGNPVCSKISSSTYNKFYLNGYRDYITIPYDDAFNLQTLTITAWINPVDTQNTHEIVSKDENGAYGLDIYNGRLRGYIYISELKDYVYVTSEIGIPRYLWSFVALTFNGNELLLYQNSKIVGTTKVSGTLRNNTMPLMIGANPTSNDENPAEDLFEGYIGEVRIYNRALTGDELGELMQVYGFQVAPKIGLKVSPNYGIQAFNASLSLLGCEECSGYTYGWDFEGDGFIDIQENRLNTHNFTYKEVGVHYPFVIIYKDGELYNWATSKVEVKEENGNLLLFLSFDKNLRDYAGNGYNGVYYGPDGPNWIGGINYEAIQLQDNNPEDSNYYFVEVDTGKGIMMEAFTLSFWVKLDEKSKYDYYHTFVQGNRGDSGDNEFYFGWTNDNEFRVCLKGQCKVSSKKIDLVDGRWHKLKFEFNGEGVAIFVDDMDEPFDVIEEINTIDYFVIHELLVGIAKNEWGVMTFETALSGALDELKLYNY